MAPVIFALFTEFLILSTIGFMMLLSLDILLPTFISTRVNLAVVLGGILSLFVLHHAISIWLDRKIRSSNPLVIRTVRIFCSLWGIMLLLLSLLKFPTLALIMILGITGLLAYLFRKAFFFV